MSAKVTRADEATHGESFAASFHEAATVESEGNPVAVPILDDEIERSGIPRKQLAAKLEKGEGQFSKMTTTGPNAQAFGLDAFERLPLPIQVAWLKRYGRTLGLDVHEIDPLTVARELIDRFEEFARFVRMCQIGKRRMAHASLPESAPERRRA